MTSFAIDFIDNGIMVIAAVFLLRSYYNQEKDRFYKNKGVFLISISLLIYCAVDLSIAYKDFSDKQLPTSHEIAETILTHGVALTENTLYSSKDGYQVLIPSGYKYIKDQSRNLSLSAIKKGAVLSVLKTASTSSLDKFNDEVIKEMKKRDARPIVLSRKIFSLNNTEALRLHMEITRKGVVLNILSILVKKDGAMFQLGMVCRKESYDLHSPEFDEIVKSFVIG